MRYIILFILLFVAFVQGEVKTKYMNGIECYCDSIHTKYHETGYVLKEIPYIGNQINGNIYEYDQSQNVIKAYSYDQSNQVIKSSSTNNSTVDQIINVSAVINRKLLIVLGTGYYQAVHYAGFELGAGYLSRLEGSENYGFGFVLTMIFAGNCEDDGYDENGIDTDDFNKRGDKGYTTCNEGSGIGIRSGINKRVNASTIMLYSGALIYSSEKKIQNTDTILGKYTGDSDEKSRLNIVIPLGINFQSSSIFGASIEIKTDYSVGVNINLSIEM